MKIAVLAAIFAASWWTGSSVVTPARALSRDEFLTHYWCSIPPSPWDHPIVRQRFFRDGGVTVDRFRRNLQNNRYEFVKSYKGKWEADRGDRIKVTIYEDDYGGYTSRQFNLSFKEKSDGSLSLGARRSVACDSSADEILAHRLFKEMEQNYEVVTPELLLSHAWCSLSRVRPGDAFRRYVFASSGVLTAEWRSDRNSTTYSSSNIGQWGLFNQNHTIQIKFFAYYYTEPFQSPIAATKAHDQLHLGEVEYDPC